MFSKPKGYTFIIYCWRGLYLPTGYCRSKHSLSWSNYVEHGVGLNWSTSYQLFQKLELFFSAEEVSAQKIHPLREKNGSKRSHSITPNNPI